MTTIVAKPASVKTEMMSRGEETTGGELAKKTERSQAVIHEKAKAMALAKRVSTVGKQMSSSASMSNTPWGKLWRPPELRRSLIMGWKALLLTFMVINIVQAADFAKLDEAIPRSFVAELAPVFDFDGDGCLPSAGISRSGQQNPGLKDTGSKTGECRSPDFLDTSNTLHRYTCTSKSGSTYCGHFYALYFEKDQAVGGCVFR
jgi:hypothetical protein